MPWPTAGVLTDTTEGVCPIGVEGVEVVPKGITIFANALDPSSALAEVAAMVTT
jgi:hypothetical protein